MLKYFNSEKIEVGIDEAGRGCLAGPVFTGAVILPKLEVIETTSMPLIKFTFEFLSSKTIIFDPLDFTSSKFDFNLPRSSLFGAIAITGMLSSISAIGPCFNSPAG